MSSSSEERLGRMLAEGKITPEQHAELLAALPATPSGGEEPRSDFAEFVAASVEIQSECVKSGRRQKLTQIKLWIWGALGIGDILAAVFELSGGHPGKMVIWGALGIGCFFVVLLNFRNLTEERRLLAMLEAGKITLATYRECLKKLVWAIRRPIVDPGGSSDSRQGGNAH